VLSSGLTHDGTTHIIQEAEDTTIMIQQQIAFNKQQCYKATKPTNKHLMLRCLQMNCC